MVPMKDTRFSGLNLQSLTDRSICRLLDKLQPDADIPPAGEKGRALLKVLKAELLRRIYLQVEQQKQDYPEHKPTIAG